MQAVDPIKVALRRCQTAFWMAFALGFFVNGLLLAVSIYSMQVFDRVLSSGSIETLFALSLIVFVALVFMAVFQWLRGAILARCGSWMESQLGEPTAQSVLSMAVRVPELGAQPLRDLASIRGFLVSPALVAALDAPWAVIFLGVLFLISPLLGWFLTGCAIVLAVIALVGDWLTKTSSEEAGDRKILALQAIEGMVANAEVIRSMGFASGALERWRQHETEAGRLSERAGASALVSGTIVKAARLLVQCAITGVAAWLVIKGDLSAGAIIAATMLAAKVLTPIDALSSIHQALQQARKAHGRLKRLEAAIARDGAPESFGMPDPTGQISLVNLSYRLPDSERWILRGVTASIAPGEAVGVVGPSGIGKSTLLRLIAGVVPPTAGTVRFDGADRQYWAPEALGACVGYLPQHVELLAGTVAENIARFTREASDEAVILAARFSRVHDLIVALPSGYTTDVGHTGRHLSAGQRQRVGLARAFFGSVRIVLLDEPNAHLDSAGEDALVRVIRDAKGKGITTVTAVHRLSILAEMDKVFLFTGDGYRFGPPHEVLPRPAGSVRTLAQARVP
mgnify:CR=1 FL=1